MMLLLALMVFLGGATLFSAGGSVPGTGLGEVQQVPAPAARSAAHLTIKRVRPVTIIVGTGFRSGEVVRLSGVNVRQVRASARGTFTIRLRNMDPCGGFSITAVGSKGSRTAIQYSQLHCVEP